MFLADYLWKSSKKHKWHLIGATMAPLNYGYKVIDLGGYSG